MAETLPRADLLETIVAATRRSVAAREQAIPRAALERRLEGGPRVEREPLEGGAFRRALTSGPSPRVIAECKRRSPSRGVLRRAYDPALIAAAYARAGAAAISVLTEPSFFDGAPEHLAAVRAAVEIPVLRKDFIVTGYQLLEARAIGADAALLIVAALDDRELTGLLKQARALGLDALVEVHGEAELGRAIDAGADIIGVNNRNLRSLDVTLDVTRRLVPRIPAGVVKVAESGLRTSDDLAALVDAGYHAFLVGERLMTAADPGTALRELIGAGPGTDRIKDQGRQGL
ncbi:MAG: indole-3-glycerol phosphate synthase TrpC [Vicinamibacterales bacterium]